MYIILFKAGHLLFVHQFHKVVVDVPKQNYILNCSFESVTKTWSLGMEDLLTGLWGGLLFRAGHLLTFPIYSVLGGC